MTRRIGIMGLGAMGGPMAERLAAAGAEVVAWNRSPVTPPTGVKLVSSPREVARQAGTVCVMVTGPEAVEAVLFDEDGWIEGAEPGHTVIQSSTVGPHAIRDIAQRLETRGIYVVDAPVSGSVSVAEKGALTILGGGDKERFAELAPVLEAFAQTVLVFGPVGTGSAVKLAVNAILISVVAAGAEALQWLDSREEVDHELLAQALGRISPVLAARVPAVMGEAPEGGFSMQHVAKDMNLLQPGQEQKVLRAVLRRCEQALAGGLQDRDLAALGAAARAGRG